MSSTNKPDEPITISVDDQEHEFVDPERSKALVEQIRAGYTPSVVEAGEVRGSIAQACTYRNSLDKEISSLEHQLTTVRTKREAIEKVISIQSSFITPIRRLPQELLLDIFDQACPSNVIPPGPQVRDRPSLVLSHTCHSWRELAFSSPKLWSRYSITLTLNNSDDSRSAEPYLAKMFIRLSKDHPLDITILKVDDIQFTWTEIDDLVERDKRTLSLLADNAWRWRSLDCYNKKLPAIPEPAGELPLLRNVTIRYDRQYPNEVPPPEPSWFTRARNIENLTIFSPSYSLFPFVWDGIKHLTIHDIRDDSLHMIHSFLSDLSLVSPNLKEFYCNMYANDTGSIIPSTFNRLTSLRVGQHVDLGWIVAPNLEHLDVSELRGERWTSEVVAGFIHTSGASLTSIAIGPDYIQNKLFSTSFESMANLVHLICTNAKLSNFEPLLESLTIRSSPNSVENLLLPRLRTFTLYWHSIFNVFYTTGIQLRTEAMVIDDHVVDFLESRRFQRPLSFERFSVLRSRDLWEAVVFKCQNSSYKDRLRQLRSGGLSLCLDGDWSPIEGLACVDE